LKERSIAYRTASERETIDLGRKLGSVLTAGDVVALGGELGSGKTCFTKGLALGLGVDPEIIVTSPSFSLMNEYEGRHPFFHMDAYRLENASDFLSAGLDEVFYDEGVVALEWADRWPEILPDWRVKVEFSILDERCRKIILSGSHPRAVEILKSIVGLKAPQAQWEVKE